MLDRLKRALGGTTPETVASDTLAACGPDDGPDAILDTVEQKTDGTAVTVDAAVEKLRAESDAVDAEFRAAVVSELLTTADAFLDGEADTQAVFGALETAREEGVLSENGFETARNAADGGDTDRLKSILTNDPKLGDALAGDGILPRVIERQGYPETFPFEGVAACETAVQDWEDPPDDSGAFCAEWYREATGDDPAEQKQETLDDVDTTPPESVAEEAQRALDWLDETGNEADCLTDDGWARANQLADREELSEETIRRMDAFFERNDRYSDAEKSDDPPCQWVSWKAWGGEPGAEWSAGRVEAFDSVRSETDQQTATETDTMADDTDTDDKQDEGGQMSALDLMEQLDRFDADDLESVQRTAELQGKDAEDVAADIVGDAIGMNAGGSTDTDPAPDTDENADKGDDYDEEDDADRMADEYVTEDELDQKLSEVQASIVDATTDAITDEETVAQIGQKLGESDEARDAISDAVVEDVDEKLDGQMTTPSPSIPSGDDAGRAADTLTGGGDE